MKNKTINYNNNLFTYKKNLSPKLHPCSSMKTIKSNFDFQQINDYNMLNNIEKETLVYSPPHILSPKFKSTRNNNKIKYKTIDYALNNSDYNTINHFNNSNYDSDKHLIIDKIDYKNNVMNEINNKINESNLVNVQNNNYFYSTLNKFHNRIASEKIIYSSFSSSPKNENMSISKNNINSNQISLYINNNSSRQIKKDKNIKTDKNNFNKSNRINYNIESYSKRNRKYENTLNIHRKKSSKKTFINYYNSNIDYYNQNYETINQVNNNNNLKIKVNLIPRPYSKQSSLSKKNLI